MATYTPQRIDQYGWIDLGTVDTLPDAVRLVDENDPRREENGDSALIGWIVARSTEMSVHSRKDGVFRIIERP